MLSCRGSFPFAPNAATTGRLVVERTVEEVFERFGPVWLLRANGRDVETTPEHPFFMAGKGWTALDQVRAGDVVRLEDGWTAAEAVEDTGSWQTVYNFRIADDHTYFVGCEVWGWAVWAHNANNNESEQAFLERLAQADEHLYKRPAAYSAEQLEAAVTSQRRRAAGEITKLTSLEWDMFARM